jgi:hypothetical protein
MEITDMKSDNQLQDAACAAIAAFVSESGVNTEELLKLVEQWRHLQAGSSHEMQERA